jgi:hypothetical protein
MEFEDTDSILAEVEQQKSETVTGTQVNPEVAKVTSKPDVFATINYKGQMVPLTQSQTIDFAQKGKDYETKMSEYRKSNEELVDRIAKVDNWESRYAHQEKINQFYAQNQDLYQNLVSEFEKKSKGYIDDNVNIPPEVKNELSTLRGELASIKDGYNAFKQEKEASELSRIQTGIIEDFQKMQKEFNFLDWNAKDEDNIQLQDHILKFANDNGIDDVELATMKYCKDKILEHYKEAGKKEALEAIKDNAKAGVVTVSGTPRKGVKPARTDTNKSFDELAKEAIAEVEQGAYG